MVLLSVLGALGIIYIMIVQMSADAMFTAQYYHKVAFKEKAYYISRSALSGVAKLMSMDDASYDSLQDPWAQEIPPYHLKEDQVNLSIKIEDQERFFNPNSIMGSGDQADEKHTKQFRRLLTLLQIDPDLSNAVLDWIDTDYDRRIPMGADGMDYGETDAKGGPLDSLEEMKLIKGFAPEDFKGKIAAGQAVPGLLQVLSVYGNGKININTARSEILMSLDDEISQDMAAEIVRRREEKPFQSMEDLLDLPGMNNDLLYRIKELSDVKSEYFKITSTVEGYDGESSDLTIIVKRSGNSATIIYWQAN